MAALDILTNHGRKGTHRIVIDVMEDRTQSLLVRGRAVESFGVNMPSEPEVLAAPSLTPNPASASGSSTPLAK